MTDLETGASDAWCRFQEVDHSGKKDLLCKSAFVAFCNQVAPSVVSGVPRPEREIGAHPVERRDSLLDVGLQDALSGGVDNDTCRRWNLDRCAVFRLLFSFLLSEHEK